MKTENESKFFLGKQLIYIYIYIISNLTTYIFESNNEEVK